MDPEQEPAYGDCNPFNDVKERVVYNCSPVWALYHPPGEFVQSPITVHAHPHEPSKYIKRIARAHQFSEPTPQCFVEARVVWVIRVPKPKPRALRSF